MKKIAIIGASHFQNPLILKAKEKGCETHVFAWESGDVGERTADVFHPISITEKERILDECRSIGIDGICSIGSDLANITVSFVADALGLTANAPDAVLRSTDKHLMRTVFADQGDPSPQSVLAKKGSMPDLSGLSYPLIVKPTDRSGSRGITKLSSPEGLDEALANAFSQGFSESAVVEEFVTGEEFSVEFISWAGEHAFLALTKKFTTGAPGFIETGHLEPAQVPESVRAKIEDVVRNALDHLGVRFGASHAEVLVDADGDVWIVEIGSRMGGDCIGSHLVPLSTGIDFTGAVVDVALGKKPDLTPQASPAHALIRFVFGPEDVAALERIQDEAPGLIVFQSPIQAFTHQVTDSSTRFGFFILQAASFEELEPYLPDQAASA